MANPFAARLAELGGPSQPEEEDPIRARLRELNPDYVPPESLEGSTPEITAKLNRRFTPQSYENIQADYARQKRQVSGEEEPHGLADLIKGEYKAPQAPKDLSGIGKGQSFGRGAVQGASLGFGDEASALIDTGISKIPGLRSFAEMFADAGGGRGGSLDYSNPDITYQQRRNAYREKNDLAQAANPKSYFGGEVVGGLATAPVLPGGPGLVGAVKAGATAGAATGLGLSSADLADTAHFERNLKQAAKDTAASGIAGAVTGGITHTAINEILKGATRSAGGWTVNAIVGDMRGASTATARHQLADDAVNAARIVRSDKELDKAIENAAGNNQDDVQHALNMVQERLQQTGLRLGPEWQQVQQSLPAQWTSGRVLEGLEASVKRLKATSKTTDRAEAAALEDIIQNIKTGADWGAAHGVFNPKAPSGMIFGGKQLPADEAIAILEKGRKLAAKEQPAIGAAETPKLTQGAGEFPRAGRPTFRDRAATTEERMNGVDHVVEAVEGDRVVGKSFLRWRRDPHSPDRGAYPKGEMAVHNVSVEPEFRRQGIASGMYEYAEKTLGKKIVRNPFQTREGEALWEKGSPAEQARARGTAAPQAAPNPGGAVPNAAAAAPKKPGLFERLTRGTPEQEAAAEAQAAARAELQRLRDAGLVPPPPPAPPAKAGKPGLADRYAGWEDAPPPTVHEARLKSQNAQNAQRLYGEQMDRYNAAIRAARETADFNPDLVKKIAAARARNAPPKELLDIVVDAQAAKTAPADIAAHPPGWQPHPVPAGRQAEAEAIAYAQKRTGLTREQAEAANQRMSAHRQMALQDRIASRPDAVARMEREGLPTVEPMASPGASGVADLDAQIQRVKDAATTKGFDPNHEITPEQLQGMWSDQAGIAYGGQGGINGTVTFERKLDVASHLRELRDQMLKEANPEAVAQLKPDLNRYSGLKRIEKVLKERLNTAKNAGGEMPDWVKYLGRHVSGHGSLASAGLALAMGHPHVAALIAAPLAYKVGKRALDRNAASLIEKAQTSQMAATILYLIRHGVSRATAINAARSAAHGSLHAIDTALQTAVGDKVAEMGKE